MSCQLDLLVTPLGGAVLAGDETHAVQSAEVAKDERVPGLSLVIRAIGETEMPAGVVVPGVLLQVLVLLAGARLDLAPVAGQDVLALVDELPAKVTASGFTE